MIYDELYRKEGLVHLNYYVNAIAFKNIFINWTKFKINAST